MDYKKIAASSRAVTHMKETASIHSPDKDGATLNYSNNLIMIDNQQSIAFGHSVVEPQIRQQVLPEMEGRSLSSRIKELREAGYAIRSSKSSSQQHTYSNRLLVFFKDLLLQRHFWKILPIALFIEFMGMVIL